MTRRLKLSPEGVQNIIDIIMSDEKLVGYVLALVSKRLTVGMREDPDWCNQVIDLSIEQVLEDVDVVQLINQICGTTSITTEKGSKNAKKGSKNKKTTEPELITPPFSATEPHAVSNTSSRRMVKDMNKRKPVQIPSTSSATAAHLLKKALQDKVAIDRSMSVESNASTVPVTDSFNNGIIISTNANTKREVAWPPDVFASARSESSISSGNDNDLYVSVLDSEAQASFRDDADHSHLHEDTAADLGETSKLDLTNGSLGASSEIDSLEETVPTPPRSSAKVPEMTQSLDRREHTLGGKNRTASTAGGQKAYKVPYKPTTFDGKLKGANGTTEATATAVAANTATVLSVSSASTSPERPQPLTNSSLSRASSTPQSGTPITPLTHTHSVGDDFLASWEKQVIQGMKSGDDESDGMDENEATNLTPTGTGLGSSFVDQLVRSPSKTLNGDLDQYELRSEPSEATTPEQNNNPHPHNIQHNHRVTVDPQDDEDRAQSATPELNVISLAAAGELLHQQVGVKDKQTTEEQGRMRCRSAESDLTDPTQDSPRPESSSHHPHRHHHHHEDHTPKETSVPPTTGIHVHTHRKPQEGDEENDYSDDSSESYSSDSSASSSDNDDDEDHQDSDTEENDYLRAPPTQQGSLLFFDQSRFDADADYFAAGGTKKAKSPPKKSKPKKKAPSDSPPRVRFAPRLISEVHYRDRVGYHEKGELFFTHNEEYQFTMDQSKEAERAEALGMTWMEWMEQRTDEDVQREEQENDNLNDFKLYSGEYYEEDDTSVPNTYANNSNGYGSGSLSALNPVPHGDHDFKAGNAHVSPVIAHQHAPHVLTTQQVLATHAQHNNSAKGANKSNIVSAKHNGVEVVFSDELSVPSCSSSEEDDEYDLNDF